MNRPPLRTALRYLLAASMVGIGATHFTRTAWYVAIVPAALPWPRALVLVSGVAEIAGGLGLLHPATRRAAAWGLVLLYLAVFPANLNMAVNDLHPGGLVVPPAFLWLRLPLQGVLVLWAWWYTRPEPLGPVSPTRSSA